MIFTERTITVVNDSATINKPLILYRGDKNIELKITIAESQFKFRNTDASNVIETTDASYAQLVINTPYNSPIFSDVAVTKNGAVIFVITEAMIDEIREVGAYEIQIRLLDDNKQSRASIPPVSNAIEIREPIAMEDGSPIDSNVVNVAKVNRALTTTSAPLEAFDSQGNYIKKTWGDGDPITDAALNKMEAGIEGVNKKIANVNNINDTTASVTTTYSSNKIETIKRSISSQIKEKTNKDEVRMKNTNITLNDCDSDMLSAIQGGEGTSFELLSIPRDNSVTPVKTDFLKSTISHNLVNPIKIVQGKKVPMTTWLCEAVEVADENYCYLALELEEGNYIINTKISGNSFVSYTGAKGSSNENKLDGSVSITDNPPILTVSGGTKKYFLNMTKTDYASYIANNGYLCLMKQSDYDIYGFEKYFDEKISFTDKFNGSIEEILLDESLKSVIDDSRKEFISINVYDRILETLTDKVINWNGEFGNLSGWKVKLIQLNLGEKLIVKGNSTTGDASHIGMLEVFSDKTPWKVHYKVGDYTSNAMEHTATKNIEYIYIVCKDTFDIKIEQPNKQYIYNTVGLSQIELLRYRFNSAICIGDSLTVGKQPNDSSRECYPSFLAKMTDMQITNAGQSGASANSWLNTWENTYNYADYECAFICLGTNGGVEKNSDNYNAYVSLINKMKNDNPNIVIFLLDCVGNNNDGTNANDIIKEIAENNNCHYLNIFYNKEFPLSGMHGSPVSDFHDIEGDPTHLSPMGYLFMARNVVNEMIRTMFNNIGEFNQRHTN